MADMHDLDEIHRRSMNKVTAVHVQAADNHVQFCKRMKDKFEKQGELLMAAAAGIFLEIAREDRDKQLQSFWDKVDALLTPGDTVEWYDGWGMVSGEYKGHSRWHIDTKTYSGLNQGHPIIIDTEWEKIS